MSNFLPSQPQIILLLAMGVLIFMLWRRSNKHFGRGGTAHQPPHRLSKLDDDRELALSDAPRDINRWQVEMHELARELKGEIDTKLALLQLLTVQATAAAERLERATACAQRLGAGSSRDPLDQIEAWQADTAAHYAESKLPQETAEIYALADAGLSPADIAARTGRPLGDIELALSLRVQA